MKRQEGLGWRVLRGGEYKVRLPILSLEEEEALIGICERFKGSQKGEVKGEEEALGIIEKICGEYCEENGIELDDAQKGYMPRVALAHTYGNLFLDELLGDELLEEIAVIGIGKPIYAYVRREGWKKTNCEFSSADAFVSCVNKLARASGKRLCMQTPRINVALTDGSRMHATIPPVCDHELTIRKFASEPFRVEHLGEMGTASFEALAFLWCAMQADLSLVVAGNTASGKTTTLNALFSFVPSYERVIIAEDTPEVSLPHGHVVRMLASEEAGVGMKEIIRDTLRMRPDRLIVGEVRSQQEVEAFMETVLAGQGKGSYCTFHAQSAQDAIRRLRMLGAMESDIPSIDLIIVQRRMERYDAKERKGRQLRKFTQICEVHGGKEGKAIAKPVFEMRGERLVKVRGKSIVLGKIAQCFGMREGELAKEMGKREKFLREICRERNDYAKSFARLQKFMIK